MVRKAHQKPTAEEAKLVAQRQNLLKGGEGGGRRVMKTQCRNRCMEFITAAGKDGFMDFKEFVMWLPPKMRVKHPTPELRQLFEAIDTSKNGQIDVCEFFLFSLRHAARTLGASLEMIFSRYDRDQRGSLDRLEFRAAMEAMGFGHAADELFNLLVSAPRDPNPHNTAPLQACAAFGPLASPLCGVAPHDATFRGLAAWEWSPLLICCSLQPCGASSQALG